MLQNIINCFDCFGFFLTPYTEAYWVKYVKNKTHLKLDGLNLNDKSIVALAKVLEKNQTVKSIDLSNNNITDIGALALAHTLAVNDFLIKNKFFFKYKAYQRELNQINDKAKNFDRQFVNAQKLELRSRYACLFSKNMEALEFDQNLERIDFTGNQIGKEGLMALLNVVYETNRSTLSIVALDSINALDKKELKDLARSPGGVAFDEELPCVIS